ncbi:MAG: histidinol-phosphate transaminase [Anaerovoracaceae bacterium]
MSRFLKKQYENLEPYTPGEQPQNIKLIKLNTNENPYPPSPKVIQAIEGANLEDLRRYPDPGVVNLVQAIAGYYQVDTDQVMVGNGSDEVLAFAFMAFQNPEKKIYFPQISYGFYPVYGDVFGANWEGIPLTEDLRINPEDYKNLEGTIVIANPNAPTGIALTLDEIEAIVASNRENLVVIDEAYVDFGGETAIYLTQKYDNLLVIQTFSKSRSLAGSRIGFAVGSSEIISDLNKIKFSFNPYNINKLTILAATAAIKDKKYFRQTRDKIMKTRENFGKELTNLGFTVLPSSANFVFCKSNQISGLKYFTELGERNIIVRHFNKKHIRDYVRITIGREEEMVKLLEVTKAILNEGDIR